MNWLMRYMGLPILLALIAPVLAAQDNGEETGEEPTEEAIEPVDVEEFDELAEQVDALKQEIDDLRPGSMRFLISGYAFSGFDIIKGKDSTFFAQLSPILLVKFGDFFMEVEIELGLEGDETEVELEYAHLTYFVHDYVTVGIGKFLTPFNIFGERLHPAWINKLPRPPIYAGHHGSLVPMTQLGIDVRGGAAFGDMKLNWAFYVSNGMALESGDDDHAGTLGANNFDDNNNSVSFGGRIGFLPLHFLEIGASIHSGRVSESGENEKIDAMIYGADFTFSWTLDEIGGTIDVRAEFVYQDIDDMTYTVGGTDYDFDNRRMGYYAQLAYRPSKLDIPVLSDLELVLRYGRLDLPEDTPKQDEGEGFDTERTTVGLNYWFNASTVIKLSYSFDAAKAPGEEASGFVMQFAIGF